MLATSAYFPDLWTKSSAEFALYPGRVLTDLYALFVAFIAWLFCLGRPRGLVVSFGVLLSANSINGEEASLAC